MGGREKAGRYVPSRLAVILLTAGRALLTFVLGVLEPKASSSPKPPRRSSTGAAGAGAGVGSAAFRVEFDLEFWDRDVGEVGVELISSSPALYSSNPPLLASSRNDEPPAPLPPAP